MIMHGYQLEPVNSLINNRLFDATTFQTKSKDKAYKENRWLSW